MFSKENRPGFGTAIVLSLPLFGACAQEQAPLTHEQLSAHITEVANTDTLRPKLEARIEQHCPEQYKEVTEKALKLFDATHLLIREHHNDSSWQELNYPAFDAEKIAIEDMRSYLFEHRSNDVFRVNQDVKHSSDRLLISCGSALDFVSQGETIGNRWWGHASTSNSNIAVLSELKTAAAALIYDCTAP